MTCSSGAPTGTRDHSGEHRGILPVQVPQSSVQVLFPLGIGVFGNIASLRLSYIERNIVLASRSTPEHPRWITVSNLAYS